MQSVTGYNLRVTILLKLVFFLCFSSFFHFESYCQQTDSSKSATVYFIRDKDLMNSAYVVRLKINGTRIIKLKNNSYHKLLFDTSAIKISQMYLHCFPVSDIVHIQPGKTYYFKYFRTYSYGISYLNNFGASKTISFYNVDLVQVPDTVGQKSIELIELNEENKNAPKEKFAKIKKHLIAKDCPINPDSSYIYFMRPDFFYGSAVPYKIHLSDGWSFLLPNNTTYIHATAASEIDIITMNKNNNNQNTQLHITLEKGHVYYVYNYLNFKNGIGSTTIQLVLIDKTTYINSIDKKGNKSVIRYQNL